ncbi:MAG: Uma2 family endonuclease [Actinomycetota bacterium]|jgi:Uma2 family endonuclease|nr:Uma2 family endonuclease [Rubrobacter sp.]MBA3790808.1 Uma2 family endonuclease [Rubrobacter sp.]MDQ3238345.1 Uma2 family endonuclease [Actinomycetota bacterium]MDQ3568380.1 Uma2 family endonuclease [Actinomycetota bacterium]
MADSAAGHGSLSVKDYLALEESANVRHEYIAGEIYAMVGVSRRHSRIAGNVFRRLANSAVGGPCRVHQSDVKFRVNDDVFYYPDVMVACGTEPENPYFEDEPCLVVEVVSPSTEATDRREKLAAYKRVSSLKAYLILDQERMRVERHFRDEEGTWRRADLVDERRFPVPCPEGTLSLAEIYEGL